MEYVFTPIRIYAHHVTTLQGERCYQSYHVAQSFQGGELSVGTIVTVSYGPGDEGTPRHRRPEYDRGENQAKTESKLANVGQLVR